MSIPMMAVIGWKTPVSVIPPQSSGNMHIVKRTIPKGTQLPLSFDDEREGVLYGQDTEVTMLIDGDATSTATTDIWMSDTPMEYYSMWELVARAEGPNVLVAGLGLGLLVHLLALRRDIRHITVVEISPDVIKMVRPYLPKYEGLTIEVIEQDFFDFAWKYDMGKLRTVEFNTVIVDIWKDNSDDGIFEEARNTCEDSFGDAVHLYWAFQKEYETRLATDLYLYERYSRKHKSESSLSKSGSAHAESGDDKSHV